MEEIKVNKLELASELANMELIRNYAEFIKIFEDDNAGITHYTDEAQDIFNELYDKYLDILEELKIG
jgi:hypothetical protein